MLSWLSVICLPFDVDYCCSNKCCECAHHIWIVHQQRERHIPAPETLALNFSNMTAGDPILYSSSLFGVYSCKLAFRHGTSELRNAKSSLESARSVVFRFRVFLDFCIFRKVGWFHTCFQLYSRPISKSPYWLVQINLSVLSTSSLEQMGSVVNIKWLLV